MSEAQIAIYCAPNAEVFAQTVADLRAAGRVLHEAATAAAGVEVPFVLCAEAGNYTVVFAAPINEQLSDDDLQLLAQGVFDFYQSSAAQGRGSGR